ncbi:mechanosensitive ion channel family protein [Escherichia coli]|uniref:Mechanosensitive ion channel family protein n=1 Tax=Escherichia coli TaxID=562 RepID=A0A2X1NJX8_ECOLX|nr:mechanosensitive ion channel family protein [Escherichia coli]
MRICLIKQPLLRQIHQADGQPLTAEQNRILEAQLRTQRELLNSLLQGGDTLLLELTKLKVSNGQLEDALKEVNEATHRYLFWTSDVRPMTIAWPLEIAQDLRRLISLDTFSQLGKAQCDDADQQRDNFAAVWRVDSGRLQYLLAPLFHPFS